MTKPSDISDPAYRGAMETADRLLDDGNYLETVRKCADTYVDLIQRRPDILRPDTPRRPSVWPGLGVKLEVEAGSRPNLVWERERFTMSEAATYLEFTLDQILRAQRTEAPA